MIMCDITISDMKSEKYNNKYSIVCIQILTITEMIILFIVRGREIKLPVFSTDLVVCSTDNMLSLKGTSGND